MPEGQPPADQDDPDYVTDHRGDPGFAAPDDRPPERPDDIGGDPESSDAEGDRNDQEEQDEADDPRYHVQDRHPPTAEDQPDQVEDEPHDRHYLLPSRTVAGRTSSAPSKRAVAAAISSTAWSNAAALRAAGARNPL